MSYKKTIIFLPLFTFCILSISCNRYIDTAKTQISHPIAQGNMTYYLDSNVLTYRSNMRYKQDAETLGAKSFKVTLPKGIRSYKISNSEDFCFYYDTKQTVFIHINLEDSTSNIETSYTPNPTEINSIITHTGIGENEKYNISKIESNVERKQAIIKKKSATILLYNIKPENYDLFFRFLSDFQFVK